MGLIQKTVYRTAVDAASLTKALRDANFQFSALYVECGESPLVCLTIDEAAQDPTAFILAYVDPGVILVASNKALGQDGVPEALADGVDKHVLTLTKVLFNTVTPAPGGEQLKVMPTSMVTVTPSQPTLVNGVITAEVGPSLMSGEVTLKVVDVAGKMFGGFLKVRFV
jgi:hypothetical protein